MRVYPLTRWQARIQHVPDLEAKSKDPVYKKQNPYKYKFFVNHIFPFLEIVYMRSNYDPIGNRYATTSKLNNPEFRVKYAMDIRIWKTLCIQIGAQTLFYPRSNSIKVLPLTGSLGLDFFLNFTKKK